MYKQQLKDKLHKCIIGGIRKCVCNTRHPSEILVFGIYKYPREVSVSALDSCRVASFKLANISSSILQTFTIPFIYNMDLCVGYAVYFSYI